MSSLPYTLFVKSEEKASYRGSIRMGVRVPIWTGGKDSQIQYQDVGSNLDCQVRTTEDNRYILDLNVERSSIYPTSAAKEERQSDPKPDDQPHGTQPLVRTFRANLALMMRDGQTTESIVATDPLNGHVVKVDVTLNVIK